jgi:hypothetical protein
MNTVVTKRVYKKETGYVCTSVNEKACNELSFQYFIRKIIVLITFPLYVWWLEGKH